MPTGVGKSIVIADIARQMIQRIPKYKIVVLTHVRELIQQNHEKMHMLWRNAPTGIYSAGLKRRDVDSNILFAGVQSVVNNIDAFDKVHLVIIDECHRVNVQSTTAYKKVIDGFKENNPKLRTIGLTATSWRTVEGSLLGIGLFDSVCVDMTSIEGFNYFINEGYLTKLIPKKMTNMYDLTNVSVRAGDYSKRDLELEMELQGLSQEIINEILEYGESRNKWLVFCATIKHAENTKKALQIKGISCEVVHGALHINERINVLKMFKMGAYQALINVDMLTTGFDDAEIDMIVMLRPTLSSSLWVQMLGRGTRPLYAKGYDLSTTEGRLEAIANGVKPDCLVLDFAGNTRSMGAINDPVIPQSRTKAVGGQKPNIKICINCSSYVAISYRTCPHCGYEFPIITDVNLEDTASNEDLIVTETNKIDQTPTTLYVHHVEVDTEYVSKRSSQRMVMVRYKTHKQPIHVYLTVEGGYMLKNATMDWLSLNGLGKLWIQTDDQLLVYITKVIETLGQPKQIVTHKSPSGYQVIDEIKF